MTKIQSHYFLLQLLFFISDVYGYDAKFELNFKTIKKLYSFKQNLDISNLVSEIFTYNSTENYNCLNELNAIANGLTSLDEWAIQSKRWFCGCFHSCQINIVILTN